MTDFSTEKRKATERLAWKGRERGQGVTRQDEIDRARATLDVTLPLLDDRERTRRDRDLAEAAAALARHVRNGGNIDDDLSGADLEAFKRSLRSADVHDERVQRLERITEEKRATIGAIVRSEPRTYGPGSEHSFYADHAIASLPGYPGHDVAVARLERHSREIGREVSFRSDEGQRALRVASTRKRDSGEEAVRAEQRAMTSASGSGGSFVTPEYLMTNYALYRTYAPSFLEQATKLPDPGFGLTMYLPTMEGDLTVAKQTSENAALVTSAPPGGYLSANLATYAGEVDLSQQLFDRSGPGIGFDQVVHAQLMRELMTTVDTAVLTTALANAGSVTNSGSFSVADFWQDVALAKSQMETTAGTVLAPTHAFFQPDFGDWALAQSDPNGRPLLLPTSPNAALPVVPAPDGGPPCGATGDKLLGLPVFHDGNIPNPSSHSADTAIVLAHMPEVYVQVTEPTLRVIPEALASTLTVVIQLYALVGTIVRYPKAVQVITGDAYPAAPSFA